MPVRELLVAEVLRTQIRRLELVFKDVILTNSELAERAYRLIQLVFQVVIAQGSR